MLEALNLREDPDKVFFISDTHWGHDRDFVYKAREFNSVNEHDAVLMDRWNKTIPQDGIVFHLGDFIFGVDAHKNIQKYFCGLNFRHLYLSPGNHTSGYRQIYRETLEEQFGRTDIEVYPLVHALNEYKKVIFMPNYYEIFLNKQPIALSHYPIESYNHMSRDGWMIHGHTHNNLPDRPDLLRIDVGIERYGGPVSLVKIKEIMGKKKFKAVDHHGR